MAALASGCAGVSSPHDLVTAARAARGEALPAFTRESDLRVHEGFQGAWRWQIAYRVPEKLRVVLRTSSEDQRLESDGQVVRTYVGGALVSQEPARTSGVAALARFVALSSLEVLADGERVSWSELAEAERPAGAARALSASFRDAPDRPLRLGFDAALRLVSVDGIATVPGLGEGPLEARFSDYRRSDGRWLPFDIRYRFRGAPLLDEHVVRWESGAPL